MYKIILIDDDRMFLKGFYSLIEWNKYGFKVVEKFYNPRLALEYVENHHVDAIITDIKMPEISGLDMARIINATYPDIKVVFFSAFCDFKYAAEAMKYDVVGYISKPIYIDQLEEALMKLSQKLDEQHKSGISEIVDSNMIVGREEIFCRWLENEQMHSELLREELGKVGMLYQAIHQQCALTIFEINGIEEHIKTKWKHERKSFYEALSKVVCIDTASYYTVQLGFLQDKLVVLYISKRVGAVSKNCVNAAAAEMEEIFGLKVLKTCFLQYESVNELKTALSKPKQAELKMLARLLGKRKEGESLRVVEEYVNEHYAENIDLESVARQCHFSPRRFSEFFRKVKGEKFVEYLNRIRIEKAKEMLLNENNSLEGMYSKVGYGSKWYFYKQFSYYTGETPAQYRKKRLVKKV